MNPARTPSSSSRRPGEFVPEDDPDRGIGQGAAPPGVRVVCACYVAARGLHDQPNQVAANLAGVTGDLAGHGGLVGGVTDLDPRGR